MVDLQTRVQELEKKVASLTEDREKLYLDMENLLMQNDSSFWSGSSVLFDRISHAEHERDGLQNEKKRLEGLVNSLREDVTQLRDMKRAADAISKQEIEKNQVLERELAFYKQRGALWIDDRNKHLCEVEELSRLNVKLEANLREAKAAADGDRDKLVKLERDLAETQTKNRQMESRLTECSRIPELDRKLKEASDSIELLTSDGKELEVELEKSQEQLDQVSQELSLADRRIEELQGELATAKQDGNNRVEEQEKLVQQLQTEVETLRKEKRDNSKVMERAEEALTVAGAQAELQVQEVRNEYEAKLAAMEGELEAMRMERDRLEAEQVASVQAKMDAVLKLSEKEAELSSLKMGNGSSNQNQNQNQNQNGTTHNPPPRNVHNEHSGRASWW